MAKYVWDRERNEFVDRDGKSMEVPDRIAMPRIQSDVAPYMSVVSNKMIDGRTARREDLKRNGCREVDPSEFTIEGCRTEKWAKRLNMPHVGDLNVKRLSDDKLDP